MTEPISTHHARRRELRGIARKLQAAEIRVGVLRDQLDQRLHYWHEDGIAVADLALAAGVSRETAYKSIDRSRRSLTT